MSQSEMTPEAEGVYFDILRKMTPEERIRRAFSLYEFAWLLKSRALRVSSPEATEAEINSRVRAIFLHGSS